MISRMTPLLPAVWIAVWIAVVPAAGRAQTPTFSSRVEVVRVDVLVTERGQPVRGLSASDFEVLDNGVPQQVDLASLEQIPLSVVLALDMSDSVAGERLDHLRGAGHALLDGLKADDQAALVTFNHRVTLGSPLTRQVDRVRAALDAAVPRGRTGLFDACFAAMMVGESEVGRVLLIVFSDGVDTTSWLPSDRVIEIAKRSDVVAYAVSAGTSGSTAVLESLTRFSGGALFQVESTRNLPAAFVKVLEEFRRRYLVSYSPRGVEKGGWHRLEVRVKGRASLQVKARPGYLAGSR